MARKTRKIDGKTFYLYKTYPLSIPAGKATLRIRRQGGLAREFKPAPWKNEVWAYFPPGKGR